MDLPRATDWGAIEKSPRSNAEPPERAYRVERPASSVHRKTEQQDSFGLGVAVHDRGVKLGHRGRVMNS